jgi:AcrR family transcriptional regulator
MAKGGGTPTRLEPRRADSRATKEQIVDAAIRVLGERPDASMAEIAAAAGVDRSTIYRRFPNRALLVEELKDEVGREFLELLENCIEGGRGDHAAILEGVISESVPFAQRYRFLNLHDLPIDHTQAGEVWLSFLREGQQAGVFRTDYPATWLSGIVRGLNLEGNELLKRGELTAAEVQELSTRSALDAMLVR